MGISPWSISMSLTSIDRIVLTGSQRRDLARSVCAGRTEQRLPMRAAIVLAAAGGEPNAQIAATRRVCEDTVPSPRSQRCDRVESAQSDNAVAATTTRSVKKCVI